MKRFDILANLTIVVLVVISVCVVVFAYSYKGLDGNVVGDPLCAYVSAIGPIGVAFVIIRLISISQKAKFRRWETSLMLAGALLISVCIGAAIVIYGRLFGRDAVLRDIWWGRALAYIESLWHSVLLMWRDDSA